MTITEKEFRQKFSRFKKRITSESNIASTSSFILFKDYLFRLHKWYQELGKIDLWNNKTCTTLEGNNLLTFVAPELTQDFIPIEEFRIHYLKGLTFDTNKYTGLEYGFIYYYIYWEILKEHSLLKRHASLPHPYESVIKILLRGHHIYKGEVGTVEIDRMTVKVFTDFTIPSLDDKFLDYIDEKYVRQGSLGIPNQEEVNQLWTEFKDKENG